MDNENQKEKRSTPRYAQKHNVIAHYNVIDVQNELILGRLIDLSQKGLRIRGPQILNVGETLSVKIELPYKFFRKNFIHLEIICRWQKKHDEKHFDAGFEFVFPSKMGAIFIEKICSLTTAQRLAMSLLDSNIGLS